MYTMPSSEIEKSSTITTTSSILNPRTLTREFLGTPGVVAVFVLCHLVLLSFYIECSPTSTCGRGEGLTWLLTTPVKLLTCVYSLYQSNSLQLYGIWLAWLVALFYIIPGPWIDGTQLRDGNVLKYKINGNITAIVVIVYFYMN
jgi:hypothetical protein